MSLTQEGARAIIREYHFVLIETDKLVASIRSVVQTFLSEQDSRSAQTLEQELMYYLTEQGLIKTSFAQ